MTRRLALIALLAAAVAAAPSASGSPGASLPIRVGVGIGPINLGMTGQQVRRALGQPRVVVDRRVIHGRPYGELEFGYGSWSVGLLGRKGHRQVVLIGTGLTRHKTPEGVGVGTTEGEFFRRMRGKGLRQRECWPQSRTTHWLLRRGGTETIFFPQPTATVGHEREIVSVEIRSSPTLSCAF